MSQAPHPNPLPRAERGKPIQREFDLPLPAHRPLLPLEFLIVSEDRDEDAILNLIELGKLRWAFDLRAKTATRREIRVWRGSLIEYRGGKINSALTPEKKNNSALTPALSPRERVEHLADGEELDAVIESILPGVVLETIRGRELANRFACSSTHLINLIEGGELEAAGPIRRGPNGSPAVKRSSVVEFLRRRVVGES